MFLALIGSALLFPLMTNSIGRKKTIIFSGIISSASLFLAGFSSNFFLWLGLVLLSCVGFGGLENAG